MREDLTLGVCTNCGGELRVLRGKTGKRFAACVGKEGEEPSCPARRGRAPAARLRPDVPAAAARHYHRQRAICAECGWPEIKVLGAGGRGRPWVLCIDIDCPSKEKYRARTKKDG